MATPGIDLTGKLIIKVALGDDIRRILITNEDITYDELVLMMQRVYRGKLSSNDDIVIKYRDEDNDLITIFDSSDISFAIQCSRILKITLFVNGKPEQLQTDELKLIKGELRVMRDRCNKLLDHLDSRSATSGASATAPSDGSSVKASVPSGAPVDSPRRPSPSPRPSPATSGAGSKEFDPLTSQRSLDEQQNKVMSSFGLANNETTERPGTPDSISSVGSASSRQQPQQPPQQPQQPQQQPQQPPQQHPGTPTHQAGYVAAGAPASGQKMPPWQNPSVPSPSPGAPAPGQMGQYTGAQMGQGQVMRSQDLRVKHTTSQYTLATDDKKTGSYNSYPQSLMQSHPYSGHQGHGRYGTDSSYPAAVSAPQGAYPGAAGANVSTHPSYSQGPGAPAFSQPGNQPSTQPGTQPQMYPGQQQYGQQQQQPGQAQPGQAQPGQPQSQPMGYNPYPPQQPSQPGQGGQVPGPQPMGPGGANPYARQGPAGYQSGYPRPANPYQPGYQ